RQPLYPETRLFLCSVLASFRGSTYRSVHLAALLAVTLLDGLFEQPARCSPVVPHVRTVEVLACHNSISHYVSRARRVHTRHHHAPAPQSRHHQRYPGVAARMSPFGPPLRACYASARLPFPTVAAAAAHRR